MNSAAMKTVEDLEQYLSLISKSVSTFSLAYTRIKAILDKVQRKKLSLHQVRINLFNLKICAILQVLPGRLRKIIV